ncbi:7086_t:CDS:2 [Ambispora gerdemannii]|uniref:7086_t:CDS:1 n=1 Tax=Ambispora gerdemannii TaxID=144530 RepID=A0A9N8ZLZ8_9GLOM|nr:7086_t:CDS:2 [Ambispora gerdemannii]
MPDPYSTSSKTLNGSSVIIEFERRPSPPCSGDGKQQQRFPQNALLHAHLALLMKFKELEFDKEMDDRYLLRAEQ